MQKQRKKARRLRVLGAGLQGQDSVILGVGGRSRLDLSISKAWRHGSFKMEGLLGVRRCGEVRDGTDLGGPEVDERFLVVA